MENVEIASVFNLIADLLELKDENPFKVRAYRTGARAVEGRSESFRKLVEEEEDLTQFPGIGKELAAKIEEMVRTGTLGFFERLRAEIPAGLVDMLRLRGVGPKKVAKIWKELDITTMPELEKAARDGLLADLSGFGKKTEENILKAISDFRLLEHRTLHSAAEPLVQALIDHMKGEPQIRNLEAAGSYRRKKDTIGDLDLLAIAEDSEPVMERFTTWDRVARIESSGETRSTVILKSGLQVDLRVVPEKSFGAALCYFTGSKEHNIHLRRLAIERGMRLSEYGLFHIAPKIDESELSESEEWVAGQTEEEIYRALDLPYIEPELREDRGEIEAAREGRLSRLINLGDIRGDLQMHSSWSDGRDSIESMVKACISLGYEYLAISDHSQSLAMTGGLDAERLRRQWIEMHEVAERHPEIRLLKSMEVDILSDGTLDLEDEMLEQLDVVVASVHSYFDLPSAKQTERIIKGISHPAVHILAHPTCRIINRRLPIKFDLDAVLQCAVDNRVAVELNAQPDRLDLKDTHLMRARELGARIVINTDAHTTETLANMRYGIAQARRAWLEKGHVINALPADELLETLAKSS